MDCFSLSFQLIYDTSSQLLRLEISGDFNTPEITKLLIDAEIKNLGYDDFLLYESTIEQVVHQAEELCEQGQKVYQEYLSKLDSKRLVETESDIEKPLSLDDKADSLEMTPTQEGELLSDGNEPVPATRLGDNLDDGVLEVSARNILALLEAPQLSFDIAECKDAIAKVDIEEDELRAYLSISQAYGGELATHNSIRSALQAQGVVFGIDEQEIDKAVESKTCDKVLIASGVKPKKGRISQFKPLVSEQISSAPTIDEQGRANYHDINEFVIVEPGVELMRRIAPGKGKPGTDVFGKVILPIAGDILPFDANMLGTRISADDPDLVLATDKGHPVISARGISVSNVLFLNNVGLSTGNVDFDGSVCINEDVADGVKIDVKIDVTGDVTVKGVVGKASIKAGGNIVILQGVIGGSKAAQNTSTEDLYGAHLVSKGSVSAHFVTHSKIRANKNIVVAEYVSHSDLYANGRIMVGQKGGKGSLFGGSARAFDLVAAKIIGSTGGTPTKIQVGAEGDNIDKLRRVAKEKRLNSEHTYDVNMALHKISLLAKSAGMTPQMKEKTEDLSAKLLQYQSELTALKSKEEELKKVLVKSKKSRVLANQKIYNNVSVAILGSSMKVTEEMTGGHFKFDARKVVFER